MEHMKLTLPNGSLDIEKSEHLRTVLKFTSEFCGVLDGLKIKYVLVSGFVVLVFGRQRMTEDIDVFMERIGAKRYAELLKALSKRGFEPISTSYYEQMSESNVRFANRKYGFPNPNMQVGFPKSEVDAFSLDNPLRISVDKKIFLMSEIELQIAFKLKRFEHGKMEKDLEDAVFLCKVLTKNSLLNKEILLKRIDEFKVRRVYDKYLGGL